MRKIICFAAVLLFSGVCLAAEAQNKAYKNVQPLLSTSQSILGEPLIYPGGGAASVQAIVVTIDPGEPTQWHQHGVPLLAYVLSGELTVDYGPKHGKKVFKPGEAFMEAMAVQHRGTNLGSSPVRILAVFMGASGLKNTIREK